MGRGSNGYYLDEEGAARAAAARGRRLDRKIKAALARVFDGEEILVAGEAESGWSPWPAMLDGTYALYTRRYRFGVTKSCVAFVRTGQVLPDFLVFRRAPRMAHLSELRVAEQVTKLGWLQARIRWPHGELLTLKFEPAWGAEGEALLKAIREAGDAG